MDYYHRLSLQWALAPCLILWIIAACHGATLTITDISVDDIVCSGNATLALGCTPLSNNTVALEILRAACEANSLCSAKYGQDDGPDLATFTYIFTTTSSVAVNELCLETIFFNYVCNQTTFESAVSLWVQQELVQTNHAVPCDSNERFVLNSEGTGGVCVCQPDKVCDDVASNSFVLGVLLFCAILLGALAWFGFWLWNRVRVGPQIASDTPAYSLAPPQPGGPGVSSQHHHDVPTNYPFQGGSIHHRSRRRRAAAEAYDTPSTIASSSGMPPSALDDSYVLDASSD